MLHVLTVLRMFRRWLGLHLVHEVPLLARDVQALGGSVVRYPVEDLPSRGGRATWEGGGQRGQ